LALNRSKNYTKITIEETRTQKQEVPTSPEKSSECRRKPPEKSPEMSPEQNSGDPKPNSGEVFESGDSGHQMLPNQRGTLPLFFLFFLLYSKWSFFVFWIRKPEEDRRLL